MWQITTLFIRLPEWIWPVLFFTGAITLFVSYFINKIPIVNTYNTLIRAASYFLIIFSVWFMGALSNEYNHKVNAVKNEEKLQQNKEQSDKITADLNTKIEELKITLGNKEKDNTIISIKLQNALDKATQTEKEKQALLKKLSTETLARIHLMTEAQREEYLRQLSVIYSLNKEEIDKYEKMNLEQKKKFENTIQKLTEHYNQCPTIPEYTANFIEKEIKKERK